MYRDQNLPGGIVGTETGVADGSDCGSGDDVTVTVERGRRERGREGGREEGGREGGREGGKEGNRWFTCRMDTGNPTLF